MSVNVNYFHYSSPGFFNLGTVDIFGPDNSLLLEWGVGVGR